MTTDTRSNEIPPAVQNWLQRQSPAVQEAIRADDPISHDCLQRLAALDVALPNANYFDLALDLLDSAGSVAFQVGVTHFKTENELRIFLSLAGTALYGDRSAIARFEQGFGPDAAVDEIVLFLQAELEMLDGGFPGE